MPRPTETALKARARGLLEAMTERARWIYALPLDMEEAARGVAIAEGMHISDEDKSARAVRFETRDERASLVLFASPDLDVLLLEAAGADIVPVVAKVLDKTGFYAQSQLLGTALDIHDPEASKALRTLAHMVVGWDEDWSDLFLLHLASPDAVARHEATIALGVAVMVARDKGPAAALLDEAIRREKFPKLRDTMKETLNLVHGVTGGPIELKPDAAGS